MGEARAELVVRRHVEADITARWTVLPLFERQLRMGMWLAQSALL